MKIAVYMNDIIYKYGGAEGYTATLINVLQNIFQGFVITILTESYESEGFLTEAQFAERQNKAYGLNIKPDFIKLVYIAVKKSDSETCKNKFFGSIQFLNRQKVFFSIQRQIEALTKDYDLFISCVARWSFFGNARENCVMIHFPKDKLMSIPINNKLPWCKALAKKQDKDFVERTDLFLPNSQFTSSYLTKKWQITEDRQIVLYPPVTPVFVNAEKKQGQIFICSRIEASKKIDLLIKAFASSEFLKNNCKLVVAGSIKGELPEYIENVQKICPNVEFHFEPSRDEIEKLYAESEIFWHAKGINEENPMYFEHFGITTVEAMSAGCVPIVINKGGQKEIVNESCGFKWNTLEELVTFTENLVKNHDKIAELSKNALLRSELYTKKSFEKEFRKILLEKLQINTGKQN